MIRYGLRITCYGVRLPISSFQFQISHQAFRLRPLCADPLQNQAESFEKCSILVKIKEGENFNHRNPAYSGIKYFED